jgi:hypothetical protein
MKRNPYGLCVAARRRAFELIKEMYRDLSAGTWIRR